MRVRRTAGAGVALTLALAACTSSGTERAEQAAKATCRRYYDVLGVLPHHPDVEVVTHMRESGQRAATLDPKWAALGEAAARYADLFAEEDRRGGLTREEQTRRGEAFSNIGDECFAHFGRTHDN